MPLPPDANPNHASIAVTQGILGLLNDDELEGVIATNSATSAIATS